MASSSLVLWLSTEPSSSLHKIVFSFSRRSVVFCFVCFYRYIYIFWVSPIEFANCVVVKTALRKRGSFFFFPLSLSNTEAVLSVHSLSCFVNDDRPKHGAFRVVFTLTYGSVTPAPSSIHPSIHLYIHPSKRPELFAPFGRRCCVSSTHKKAPFY